jgi:uncharacterized protein (DUF1501 family)
MIVSRRRWLQLAGVGVLLGAARARPAGAAPAAASPNKVLVVLFQRGAVDGLAMVPAYSDPRYQELRPNIALPPPGQPNGALRLDATFALHPALAALQPLWNGKSLAIVHAVGSPDETRSHFDAQDFVESGTPGVKATDDGWLNRALAAKATATTAGAAPASAGDVRAVAFAPTLPRILSGHESVLAGSSLKDFRVQAPGMPGGASNFEQMYASAVDQALRGTASEAFGAMAKLRALSPQALAARNGADYPDSPLGKRLQQIAALVRAGIGLEVAMTDCGGWDTHAQEGGATGQLAGRLADLGKSVAAFAVDLGDRMRDVCLVTVTEFGRTVRENGTRGTDHGHGSVMLVLGGGVRGGKVHATWHGLADDKLHEARDLPVTTDHRQVFAAVLQRQLGLRDLSAVYPGFDFTAQRPLALF